MDFGFIKDVIPLYGEAAVLTLKLSLAGIVLSFAVGLVCALVKFQKIPVSGEAASILVFTLWGTAEMGDLVRGALESVPKHQYESGKAIGLTDRQVFFYIIIPQTLRSLIPLSMNLITRMIKTTSLVVFVGVIEVVKIGQQIVEANRLTVPTASIAVYFVIFMMYFFVCWILNLCAKYVEKRL